METLDVIFMITIMLVVVSVSTVIIVSLGFDIKNTLPGITEDLFKRIISQFVWEAPFNVCKAYSGRDVSYQNFQTLLQAVSEGQCKDARAQVKLSFSLSKEEIKELAQSIKIAGNGEHIFYNFSEPLGIGGLIIQGNPGYYPLKLWDEIEIWQEGDPDPDTFIKVLIQGCDPYDKDCDYTCIFRKICDPVCDNGKKYDVPCNPFCIDSNNNGFIDAEDAVKRVLDNKCSPDCYSNVLNSFRAYDPGCVHKFRDQIDDICDPNSNGVKDGVCDPDCARVKGVCDPDCHGTTDDNNPLGAYDEECWVCDKKCNGWCSPACKNDLLYPKIDPDCMGECDGNGLCNDTAGENCVNAPLDCLGICLDQNKACCAEDPRADFAGCSNRKGVNETDVCYCSGQCRSGLECDKTGHCCPPGKELDVEKGECVFKVCPPQITSCYNHWHWDNYGSRFRINIVGQSCDYFETCQNPIVQAIAEEIIKCCDSKCSGNCHSLCNKALSNSGLGSTDTSETRKKCYGLYAIYGLGPAARWMRGYMIHLEQPASIMLSQSTWMCTGYSIATTTLLRSVGYEKDEAYTICGPMHAYNLVKLPGDTKYHLVDTTGNKAGINIGGTLGGYPYCSYGGCSPCIMNDEGGTSCPPRSQVYGC